MKHRVYLDYAAATPVCKEALMAMEPYLNLNFYNPSALYLEARKVRQAVEQARSIISQAIGSQPGELIFTAGGTEANNLAIHGIMAKYPDSKILVSAIEHEAVLEPASQYSHQKIAVNHLGEIDLNALEDSIDDEVVLISVMYANNEVGTIQPISKIAEIVKKIRRTRRLNNVSLPLYFHTDACQASLHLDIHVKRLGVDLMTINSGKVYGPKQVGALYIKAGLSLKTYLQGGGQERGLRSGTENVSGIIGFATALEVARRKTNAEKKRLELLRDEFIIKLISSFPEVVIHGHRKHRLPHNVSFALSDIDNEALLMMLDEAGFMVATGSACQAASALPSHVLQAMGVSDELARSTIRLSFGRETTLRQLDDLLKAINIAVKTIKDLY